MLYTMPEEFMFIEDPEKIKLAIDLTRRKILELLRFNSMTVSQVAGILEKDQSTIYRHVEKLLKAGFIEQSGERKEHHIPEKVYSRTAKIFFLAPGIGALSGEEVIAKHHREMFEKTSKLMGRMGYKCSEDTEKYSMEFFTEMEKLVQVKIKELGPDIELDFNTLRRLRTAIILIETHNNPELKDMAEAYVNSFV